MKNSSGLMRHTTVLFLLLAGGISVLLFSVKYQVQDLEEDRVSLIQEIKSERRAIHVLNAEWSYLNNPARIGALAEKHLGFGKTDPENMFDVDGVEAIPFRKGVAE